jgi:hypothetical protein
LRVCFWIFYMSSSHSYLINLGFKLNCARIVCIRCLFLAYVVFRHSYINKRATSSLVNLLFFLLDALFQKSVLCLHTWTLPIVFCVTVKLTFKKSNFNKHLGNYVYAQPILSSVEPRRFFANISITYGNVAQIALSKFPAAQIAYGKIV